MVERVIILWIAVVTIVQAGCGGQTVPAEMAEGNSSRNAPHSVANESLPLVDHPEYMHWCQFPVGTAVTRKKEVTNEHGTVRVTTIVQLTEKTDDKVVVETQVTIDRLNGRPEVNPSFPAEFPAKFRLPASMKLEQFSLPSLKAERIGDEARAASGREYQAQVFSWEERNETGPMGVKLWRSNEIPGRLVRQEIDGPMHHSIEETVEISWPPTEGC